MARLPDKTPLKDDLKAAYFGCVFGIIAMLVFLIGYVEIFGNNLLEW